MQSIILSNKDFNYIDQHLKRTRISTLIELLESSLILGSDRAIFRAGGLGNLFPEKLVDTKQLTAKYKSGEYKTKDIVNEFVIACQGNLDLEVHSQLVEESAYCLKKTHISTSLLKIIESSFENAFQKCKYELKLAKCRYSVQREDGKYNIQFFNKYYKNYYYQYEHIVSNEFTLFYTVLTFLKHVDDILHTESFSVGFLSYFKEKVTESKVQDYIPDFFLDLKSFTENFCLDDFNHDCKAVYVLSQVAAGNARFCSNIFTTNIKVQNAVELLSYDNKLSDEYLTLNLSNELNRVVLPEIYALKNDLLTSSDLPLANFLLGVALPKIKIVADIEPKLKLIIPEIIANIVRFITSLPEQTIQEIKNSKEKYPYVNALFCEEL